MAVTQAVCLTFKEDLFNGVHQPGDDYAIALYDSATATLNKSTTAYTATGEVSGLGYTAGGKSLTGRRVGSSADLRYLTFDNPVWTTSTITADAALIYNKTRSNKALGVLKFTTASSVNGPFTIQLPAVGATALFRIP